jgi:hypothetical protein
MSNPRTYYRFDGTIVDRQQILDWCVQYAGDKYLGKTMFMAIDAIPSDGRTTPEIVTTPGASEPTKLLIANLIANGVYRFE